MSNKTRRRQTRGRLKSRLMGKLMNKLRSQLIKSLKRDPRIQLRLEGMGLRYRSDGWPSWIHQLGAYMGGLAYRASQKLDMLGVEVELEGRRTIKK